MNILITLIGKTDLVKKQKDGPFLHILRYLPIDEIHMFFTREIYLSQKDNHIYSETALELGRQKGKTYVIFPYPSSDLITDYISDPHLFGRCDKLFYDWFSKIKKQHPNDTFYVNMTSGTAQMLSALYFVAIELSKTMDIHLIQVEDPDSNYFPIEHKYTPHELLAPPLNIEATTAVNRSKQVGFWSFFKYQMKEDLLSTCRAYDYKDAMKIYRKNLRYLPTAVGQLIRLGEMIITLHPDALNHAQNIQFPMDPFATPEIAEFFMYILYLDIQQKQGELMDFARGISPLLKDLFLEVVERVYLIPIKKYLGNTSQMNYAQFKIDYPVFSKGFPSYMGKGDNNTRLYFSTLVSPILNYAPLNPTQQFIHSIIGKRGNSGLVEFESIVRNGSAHEIMYIDEQFIRQTCGMVPSDIIGKLKTLFELLFQIKPHWDLFSILNQRIVDNLEGSDAFYSQ